MEPWLLTLVLFGALVILIILGLPIAFTLAGLGIFFTLLLWGPSGLFMITSKAYSTGVNFVLVAVPLFIFMANMLECSGLASDLYNMIYRWLQGIPGGLASGTVVICAIFAAMCGISGAATVTMGLIAIPAMLSRMYDKRLVTGTISAGGALGILIPPSIIAIIYGSLTGASIGMLFMGGLIPGIILAMIFILYISIRALLQPELAPKGQEKFTLAEKMSSLIHVIGPIFLILLVLGTIYFGVCTPTEAAAIGAFGALIIAAIHGKLTWENLKAASLRSLNVSCMCLWIVFGASCFSAVYTIGGASEFMLSLVEGLPLPPLAMIMIMQLIYIILGMFMDPAGMVTITAPVFVPIVMKLGFDPVWFGVLFIINSEMAYITPPFGFNLFYMKAIVPPEITMVDIYRSVVPFTLLQFLCLVLVMFVPEIAMWLPNTMIGK